MMSIDEWRVTVEESVGDNCENRADNLVASIGSVTVAIASILVPQ